MRYLLMLPPALTHLLICAHLLYQGAPLWVAALPLIGLPLLVVRRFPLPQMQMLALLCYAIEWVRTTWALTTFRLEVGISIHPAIEILGGVALFTLLSALVFRSPMMRH